ELLEKALRDGKERRDRLRVVDDLRHRDAAMIEAGRQSERGHRRTEAPAEVGETTDEPRRELDVVGAELAVVFTEREQRVGERDAGRVDALVLRELVLVLVFFRPRPAMGAARVRDGRQPV